MTTNTITNILINNHHYKLDIEQLTGSQLKSLDGISPSNTLYREARGQGDDEPIDDNTPIQLHDGDRFYDMPQGNFGS